MTARGGRLWGVLVLAGLCIAPVWTQESAGRAPAADLSVPADLKPLLKANGLTFDYPTLIWWTKAGVMRGCVCQKKPSYRFVLKELAA